MALNQSYFIFSDEETYSYAAAKSQCEEQNGNLASIADEFTQSALTDAVENYVLKRIWNSSGDLILQLINFLHFSFRHEKETKLLCTEQIQTRLEQVVLFSEFFGCALLPTSLICCLLDSSKRG